ncbi:MAG: hypothetical protein CMJ46_03505 [Planctomyces sp.]|nr:hypothetical protein [Planctomyces sp.]
MSSNWITNRLEKASPTTFSVYCIVAAFGAYFCMYAFRKPFTAATYEGMQQFEISLKTVLVTSQVFGYMVSKFLGIKVISEMPPHRRTLAFIAMMAVAEGALLLYAIVPLPLKFVCLFLNGLPLGMIFGLVLSYLEGRRVTEALNAGLCASFILSSGVVKTVALRLMEGVNIPGYGTVAFSPFWMPFVEGLIFSLPLFFFVWMLRQIPPPHAEDIAQRSERRPMTRSDRWDFFQLYAFGLTCMIVTYILLTIVRSIRDDFATEIWIGLGELDNPDVFAHSEFWVMIGVTAVNGAAIFIRNNRTAFRTAVITMIGGFLLTCLSVVAYQRGLLGGFSFMVISGMGMYVPYVAFHTTLFERMIAVFRAKSNLGYLMYLADATGYLGYVIVMLARNSPWLKVDHLKLYLVTSVWISLASLACMIASLYYFERRMIEPTAVEPEPEPATV